MAYALSASAQCRSSMTSTARPPPERAAATLAIAASATESDSPSSDVATAVRGLRASKGMLLDAADHDTWSAGSFFTNPVLAAGEVPEGAPAWEQPDGRVKTSAAWLIDRAGFG